MGRVRETKLGENHTNTLYRWDCWHTSPSQTGKIHDSEQELVDHGIDSQRSGDSIVREASDPDVRRYPQSFTLLIVSSQPHVTQYAGYFTSM